MINLNKKAIENSESIADATILQIIISMFCKLIKFALKFTFYLCIMFTQMILDLFQKFIDVIYEKSFGNWEWLKNREQCLEERRLSIEVEENKNTYSHTYKMRRSKKFNKTHEQVEDSLGLTRYRDVTLDTKMAEDILKKVDYMVIEAEKNALREGYGFARTTKGELDDDNIYSNFIKYKVMRGE